MSPANDGLPLEADGVDYSGGDFAALQTALQSVIQSRRGKSAKKQQELLAAVQSHADAGVLELEQSAVKCTKEVAAAVRKNFSSVEGKLKAKFQQLEDANARFQSELQCLWQEYEEIYNTVELTKTEAVAAVEKKSQLLKRKASALHKDCNDKLREAEGKIQKLKVANQKIPDVGQFLQALIA